MHGSEKMTEGQRRCQDELNLMLQNLEALVLSVRNTQKQRKATEWEVRLVQGSIDCFQVSLSITSYL